MAPTIPIDYTGQRESKKLSKSSFGDMMGKTRKVSKGFSTGFVPDYRHAVETVAESDGLGSSGRVDMELTGSQDSFPPNRKSISLNTDGYERSNVPIQVLQLSKMSPLERRDLNVRLKIELEQVRKLQRKIDSFSFDSINDIHGYQNGPKRPAMVESLPLSTNDVPTAPGKKKIPTGRNGPRTKGGTVASRRNEPVRQQSFARSTNSAILMKQCETLLTRLMSHQHAWIFNEPVDVVKHNIPDYFTVIKHPMDLGTIKSKLLSNQYSSPLEFAADVRLTFKNALTYNPPKHDVHTMAEIMNKFFEVRWKPIQKKIPPIADESTPSKSSIVTEPESGYVQPPAKKQKTFTEKTIIMENKVKQEMDKPTMSNEEKEKLGLDLQELMEELPDNILNFLKENTLNSGEVSEDEIEIDIDALSDDTLFTLRKLVNGYLLEKQQKQAKIEPCENELQKESGFSNLSVEPCKDNEATDEDVDIGGNEPPLVAGSTPMKIDNDALRRNSNCSSSRSSSSESDSSSTDSESSPDEVDGVKNSVPETVDTEVEQMKRGPGDPSSRDSDGHAEQNLLSNSSTMEPSCHQEGESAPPETQVSPGKLYRAAVLRGRFADLIIKAQENTNEKGDQEKLKLEKEELERRRKEEKARLQAEAKAAEEARKKAEAEAAAEARKKRELEREAARQALQQMEKTVDINENSHFMEDLEMFKSAPDEPLQNLIEEASPETSHNGLGSFKFQGSKALEQLGLYMKNDEEEEEEIEPQSVLDTSNDPEEGEID